MHCAVLHGYPYTFPRVVRGESVSPVLVTWIWLDSASSPRASQSIQYQWHSALAPHSEQGRRPEAAAVMESNSCVASERDIVVLGLWLRRGHVG